MASEGSQLENDLNIYFVIPSNRLSENECSDDMWHAFNSCDEHELSPKWIKEQLCEDLKPGKKDVFVLSEFEGPTFEKLAKLKCSVVTDVASRFSRIVGPRCLLSCFMTGEPIPEGTSPVFTTAMRGLVVSVSGLSSEAKENVGRKVEYMGGVFTRQLRSSATHLVANFVMSAKYERAIELKIPIMTEQWVTAVWEASLVENVRATSSRFDEYKCPVFMNLVVTSTNLSKREKQEVKELVSAHGGIFMGALDGTKVKIVIAPKTSTLSEKLKYALQNNIACVRSEWLHESIKHGYALPFPEYLINSTKGCSTPEKSHANATLNFSSISTISGEALHPNAFVEETMTTLMSNTMDRSVLETKRDSMSAAYVAVLARLNVHEAKMAGPFLDGCNIYLTGFPPDHREKLNRILNVGSATRLDDISDAVTHVIIGDSNKALGDLKLMKSMGWSPYFLTINWLEESMKIKSTAAEEDFIYKPSEDIPDQQKMEPSSPLSKKNLQLLQKPKRPPVPVFDIDKTIEAAKEIEEPDLVQEYLKSNLSSATEKSVQEDLHPRNKSNENDKTNNTIRDTSTNFTRQSDENRAAESADDTTIPMTQPSEINERILEGLTFILTGFDDEEHCELAGNIETLGGKIVSKSFKGIPDFGVVPLIGAALKHTVKEIITDLFIEDCIDQETVVDVKYYHRPVSVSKDATPLSECVIAMSSYTGKERTFLSNIAQALGARYQDTFARRTYLNRNTYGCTHLVCPLPEGSKYNAAVKWKLPAVTADWLLACLAQQRRVDETEYLVGESTIEERPEASDTAPSNPLNVSEPQIPACSVSDNKEMITPKRQVPLLRSSSSFPAMTPINKRLSISDYKTPPSPFHLSTPDTPYGQFLKPDPSPSTRKRWLKWADDMPDMRVDEPPLKRRAPSTPLAELKRQLWEKMKEPLGNRNEADTDETTNKPVDSNEKIEGMNVRGSPSVYNPSLKPDLSFGNENSPIGSDQINLQLAQLNQVLQASTPEMRHSLSAESAKQAIYDSEPVDHIAKCAVKDSQPDTVGWEDPVHSAIRRKSTIPETAELETEQEPQTLHEKTKVTPPQKRKFMLSGIKERNSYEKDIIALGGEVSTETSYDPLATHLLCKKPGRNEKMLSSIAAGKWVLHCIYLRDSKEKGMFLDEENYEWGNPKSRDVIPQPTSEIDKQVAAAVYRWRLRLLENPGGAFNDMVALVMGPPEKCNQFQTLIRAGGGTVLEARPPYNTSPNSKKITHCFIHGAQLEVPVNWAMMASKGILCFLPQYLNDHLISVNPLNPRDCVLPEFKKYLSLVPK